MKWLSEIDPKVYAWTWLGLVGLAALIIASLNGVFWTLAAVLGGIAVIMLTVYAIAVLCDPDL